MLPGRLCAALLNRTRWLVTAISLEEKFCTFAAAQAAHRISIPSQSFLPPVSNTDGKVYRLRIYCLNLESLILEFEILNSQTRIRGPTSFRATLLPIVGFPLPISNRFCQPTSAIA